MNVSVSYDIDDFPYIKKYEMLYLLHTKFIIHPNIQSFITSNTIPKIYPNISLKSIWTNDFTNELKPVLDNYDIIVNEVMDTYNNHGSLYTSIGNHYGDKNIDKWDSCNIIKDRNINVDVIKYFPNTIKIISQLKSFYGWLFVSVLEPGAHIPKHRGRYNHKLTCHIGIDGLDNCEFRIDNKILKWVAGEYFVFNDFSYHEVIHTGNKNRIVLIFDLFHPELDNIEHKQLKFLGI
jgi:hypothetical protein